MNKQEVLALMKSSKDKQEWNDNCDKVKSAHNNEYPEYWFLEVIQSGLIKEVLNDENAGDIKIISY